MIAINKLAQTKFSAAKIKQNPLQYDTNTFVKHFIAAVEKHWQQTRTQHR
jgi:hypothetical protein